MSFYIRNNDGKKIATFEYFEGTGGCDDCNEIIIKAGSLMSKHTECMNKWYDCKWIEDTRQEAIRLGLVEEFDEDYYVLKADMRCKSPVKAASVLLGHIQTDSWDTIEDDEGNSLRDVFRK